MAPARLLFQPFQRTLNNWQHCDTHRHVPDTKNRHMRVATPDRVLLFSKSEGKHQNDRPIPCTHFPANSRDFFNQSKGKHQTKMKINPLHASSQAFTRIFLKNLKASVERKTNPSHALSREFTHTVVTKGPMNSDSRCYSYLHDLF